MARDTIRKNFELDRENVMWFAAQYPRGSLNGILDMLLARFREANEKTPADYAAIAARVLTEEIHGS